MGDEFRNTQPNIDTGFHTVRGHSFRLRPARSTDHPCPIELLTTHRASPQALKKTAIMHLMYTVDSAGKRVYTLKKVVSGEVTKSAHPARFSPDDKYSRHRVTLKKRYGLLLTQQKDLKVLGQ